MDMMDDRDLDMTKALEYFDHFMQSGSIDSYLLARQWCPDEYITERMRNHSQNMEL